MRDIGGVDDRRHDEDNARPYLEEADILPKPAEYPEPDGAHIKAVHQRGEDKEQEVRRAVLCPSVKECGDARVCQEDEAEDDEPRPPSKRSARSSPT